MEQWYVVAALLIMAVFLITRLRRRPVVRPAQTRPAQARPPGQARPAVRRVRQRSAPVSSDLAALAYWTTATAGMIVTQVRLIRQASRAGWHEHARRSATPMVEMPDTSQAALMSRPVGSASETAAESAISVPEMVSKQPETPETRSELDDNARRQIELALLAKLVKAKVITNQTRALEAAFDVRAGGGREYQALRTQLTGLLTPSETPAAPVQEDTATRVAKTA